MNNQTRRQWRETLGDPQCAQTRVLKLVKELLHPKTAKLDRSLARFQALALDVVGLLMTIVEQGVLTTEQAVEAAKLALKFAGNMSVPT